MATADELLSTIDTDKTLIIDKDLRTIIIPSSVKNLGVESDDDVLRLKFSMPRMYGDVDLSDFSIYINYMNAKNTGDVYIVDDKTIADDTITFSWLVGRVALAYKGNVRFIVCMKKHDDNSNVIQEYNTTIASLPVLEGLETGETVIQQNPDIIEMLLTLSEPLVGTTQTITPSQVLAAIKEGRDIALQYTDSYYGTFVFGSFNANEKLGIVVSNSILPQMNGLTGTLLGFVDDAGWIFKATNMATKDDVGTAVNEALTAAKASGEFDGADGITPTIGDNGNWHLGSTDTGKPSRGEKGDKGDKGDTGAAGATGATGADGKSAYSYAQDGGYTGTEAEFAAKLAAEKLPNPYPLTFTGAVSATYDGSSAKTITIPSGGGGGEKEWTVLVDQELSAETPGSFSITGLNNFTEFYAEWDALQHGANNTTNSGMYFWINNIQVSVTPSFCPVYAPSNTPRYGWTMAKYNGLRWLLAKSDGATSKENTSIASNMITQYYPSNITAPATKVHIGNEGTYAPVSGHFKLWGR